MLNKTLSEGDTNLGFQRPVSFLHLEKRNLTHSPWGSDEPESSAVQPHMQSLWQVIAGSGRSTKKAMFGPGSKPEIGEGMAEVVGELGAPEGAVPIPTSEPDVCRALTGVAKGALPNAVSCRARGLSGRGGGAVGCWWRRAALVI